MKTITFVSRHPEYPSKKVAVSREIDLDRLSPAARFLADSILTTVTGDDLSIVYVCGPSPRERNIDQDEIAIMDRQFPGLADNPETITWSWPELRTNEDPVSYFERQAADMHRIGAVTIKSRTGSCFDLASLGASPAETIRCIRAAAGLTQAAFAAAYGIPKRTFESWEMGERTPPPYVIRLLEAAVAANRPRED